MSKYPRFLTSFSPSGSKVAKSNFVTWTFAFDLDTESTKFSLKTLVSS